MRYLVLLLCLLLSACTWLDGDRHPLTPQYYPSPVQPLNDDVAKTESVDRYQRYIIMFDQEPDFKLIEESNGYVIDSVETLSMVTATLPISQVEHIRDKPHVRSVEEDDIVEINPAQQTDWGIPYINTPHSWQSGLTGKGIKVAVIDSGIEPNHEDLLVRDGVSFVRNTASYADDNGHGTHVAGIISALDNQIGTVGVAPEAELYAVKVLDRDGMGYLSDVISGIDWAIQNKMDIINLSLGLTTHSSTLRMIIDKAYNQQIIIVAAAGNEGNSDGTGDTVSYPARYDSTIAVAAIDSSDRRAPFSSTGETVEISAPGVNVLSTYIHNTYQQANGTSMAAPYVTGTLALLKQAYRTTSVLTLRELLTNHVIDLGTVGRDPSFGYGLAQTPVIPFPDIFGHWAISDIMSASDHGWMRGTGTRVFSPNVALTRAQAAVILSRILNLQAKTGPVTPYEDVPPTYWAKQEIDIITQHDIMRGVGDQQFAPNREVNREEMAVMLARVLQAKMRNDASNPFTDIKPSRWSYPEIVTMNEMNIFRGLSATTFGPRQQVTRAQMSSLLNRVYPYVK